MKEFSVSVKEKLKRLDPVILFCVLGMNMLSIVTLWSASDAYGTWYVKVQTLASVFSFFLMILISFIDYDALISKAKYVFFAISVILIIIVKYFGTGSYGNENWITIPNTPISIQPTEFVKITFIITFAVHLAYIKDKINRPLHLLGILAHGGLIIGMVMWQGDTGMALVYLCIMVFMMFGAGLSLWYFGGAGAAGIIASPFIWEMLTDRQQRRILAGFNPDIDPTDAGWQAILSRNCIVSGGFTGAGLNGGEKYKDLWGGQSDFIFAVLAEKFGFIGTFLYIALIVTLIIRLMQLACRVKKTYASYICIGIAGMLIAQSVENIGMCLSLLPVVGITLPFMSYGASSILALYISMGVVQSICTHNKNFF